MKTKKWLLPLIVIVLLLLVIPIPTGTYRDGGTREYTALTYKIVDWNHLYDGGVYDVTKVYPFPMNFMSVNVLLDREEKDFIHSKERSENSIDIQEMKPCDFNAQYIRTDGYCEDTQYPVVKIIRSVDELRAYYEANKSMYNLERYENPGADYTIGFLDACDQYDEVYFEDQILVMVLLQEGSGSNRHKVNNVGFAGEDQSRMVIDIALLVPEVGTCDMAVWHILIEPETGVEIADEKDVTVLLTVISK